MWMGAAMKPRELQTQPNELQEGLSLAACAPVCFVFWCIGVVVGYVWKIFA